MSVILDALKKAQEERKSGANGSPYDRKHGTRRPRWPFYAMAAIAVCFLLASMVVPGIYRSGQAPQAVKPLQSLPITGEAAIPAGTPDTMEAGTAKERGAAQQDQEAQGRPAIQPPLETLRTNRSDRLEPAKARKGVSASARSHSGEQSMPAPEQPPSRQGLKHEPRAGATAADHEKITRFYNEAVKEAARGNIGHAKQLYHAVLTEQPAHTEALNNLGVIAMREGNTKEALYYFDKILRYRKDYGKAYNNMGLAMMKDGQKKSAEEHFRKSLEIEKGALEPALNLAALLRAEKRYEEAGRLLEGFLGPGTRDKSLYLSYGLIKDEMGQHEEAIRYYRYYLHEGGNGAERNDIAERLRVLENTRSSQDH